MGSAFPDISHHGNLAFDCEHAMHVGTPKILNKWVDVLYPACHISRWDQLKRRVRSSALPAHRKDTTGTAPKQYLNRLWKSSNTSPQNENWNEMIIVPRTTRLQQHVLRIVPSHAHLTALRISHYLKLAHAPWALSISHFPVYFSVLSTVRDVKCFSQRKLSKPSVIL